jgi:hypothetical protein
MKKELEAGEYKIMVGGNSSKTIDLIFKLIL